MERTLLPEHIGNKRAHFTPYFGIRNEGVIAAFSHNVMKIAPRLAVHWLMTFSLPEEMTISDHGIMQYVMQYLVFANCVNKDLRCVWKAEDWQINPKGLRRTDGPQGPCRRLLTSVDALEGSCV
jgi:hypothetical protein